MMAAKTVHRKEWLWPVTVVCLVMGGLIAFQVCGRLQQGASLTWLQQKTTRDLNVQYQNQISDLDSQVRDLTAKLTKLERTQGDDKTLRDQQLLYQMALGLIPVKGPGIHLMLGENPTVRNSPNAVMAEAGLIHDFDLMQVLNELRVAGAEAIMIGEQRVVPSTAVRCVGSVIKVNEAPLVPPYDIYAIGKAEVLRGALEMPNGVLDNLRSLKFQVKLTEESEVRIQAIGPAPKMRDAHPMAETEAKAR
jgi:uncharacterized protein YlxW (UPF0749 family)